MRRTRNQLIFTPMNVLEQVRSRYFLHKKTYDRPPKRIYVSRSQHLQYRECLGTVADSSAFGGKLYFRGAEVIIKE